MLAALEAATLEGAVLELDGNSEELTALAEARTRDLPELAEANRVRHRRRRRVGPIRFGGGWYLQLPIESDTFAVLRDMLDRHADPEIAIELNVRDDEGQLVHAPDVGDNEIWVSRRFPQASLEALRAALGDGLSPPEV